MQGEEITNTTTLYDRGVGREALAEATRSRMFKEGSGISDNQNAGRIQSALDHQGSLITNLTAALNELESSVECVLEPPVPSGEKEAGPVDGSQCIVAERINDFNEGLTSLIRRINSIRNRVQL